MIDEIEIPTAGLIRIPPEMDVPLSARVRRLIDTKAVHRLSRISQLGLVHLVYPGANHSRLEHSLGVYRNSLLVLQTLSCNPRFRKIVDRKCAEAFVLASLLHDCGHWPFCHAMEDMRLVSIPHHESRVSSIIASGEIRSRIDQDWNCQGDDVMSVIAGKSFGSSTLPKEAVELLSSCLSGPIDVDKLDYLVRDSLHAGVPYGRNFDAARLVGAMTVHPDRPRLSVTEKGRTAAEMMVFARYVMFSEVYWHHAVRSATAMLQRMVFELRDSVDLIGTMDLDDAAWISRFLEISAQHQANSLAKGLFGASRALYKSVAEFNTLDRPDIHGALAHRPYWWLVACGNELARQLSIKLGIEIGGHQLLVDAPPMKLEVDINMDVVLRDGRVRKLGDVSPVAHALANRQFDGHVKRVRIFVHPSIRSKVGTLLSDDTWVRDAIETINQEVV